jgi:hypothetical protein
MLGFINQYTTFRNELVLMNATARRAKRPSRTYGRRYSSVERQSRRARARRSRYAHPLYLISLIGRSVTEAHPTLNEAATQYREMSRDLKQICRVSRQSATITARVVAMLGPLMRCQKECVNDAALGTIESDFAWSRAPKYYGRPRDVCWSNLCQPPRPRA